MLYRDVAELISASSTEDSAGYEDSILETRTEVFVNVKSVRRDEFYKSMQSGTELVIAFDLRACDYSGQKRIEYDGTQYRIVRVYTPDGEMLELNCSEYKGDRP